MLKVTKLNKITNWAVLNIFIFTVLDGFFTFIGIKTYLPTFLLILSIFPIIQYFRINKLQTLDKYFLWIIFYIFLVTVFGVIIYGLNVSSALTGLRWTIWPMFFYFLGKSRLFANNKVFNNMYYILPVFFIIVILLHLLHPAWYISLKIAALNQLFDGTRNFDLTSQDNDFARLTGFSTHPYSVSYAAFLFVSYSFYKQVSSKFKLRSMFQMLIAFIALFLALQRVPLIFSFLSIVIFSTFISYSKNKTRSMAIAILAVIFIYAFFTIRFADYFYWGAFIDDKLHSVDSSLVSKRFDMFSSYIDTSWFGKGLNYYAFNKNKQVGVTDNEWIKLSMEIGIFGLTLLIIFFAVTLTKGIKNIKYNILEIVIILFFLISMTGANPLTGGPFVMYQIFFWICLGRIYNKDLYSWKEKQKSIRLKYGRKKSKSNRVLSTTISSDTRK